MKLKPIKFDLPINGTKVKNLDELRDNLTDEILTLARSGQFERWLKTRELTEEAQGVAAAVRREGSDKGLFLALCKVLEVDLHPGDVKAIFDAPPTPGRFISGARYFQLYQDIKNQLDRNMKYEKIIYLTRVKFQDELMRNKNRLESLHEINLIGDRVVKIYVKKGDKIKKDGLIVRVKNSESVFNIVSPIDGVVRDVFVQIDQGIKLNQDLISIAETQS